MDDSEESSIAFIVLIGIMVLVVIILAAYGEDMKTKCTSLCKDKGMAYDTFDGTPGNERCECIEANKIIDVKEYGCKGGEK